MGYTVIQGGGAEEQSLVETREMGGESRPGCRAEDDILVLHESPEDRFGTTEPTTCPDWARMLPRRGVDRIEQIAR